MIILLIWTFVTLVWYLFPHRLLNVTYETNKSIKDFKGPMLIISTHNYPTADSMIMCNESKYVDKTLNIISINNYNLNQFFKSIPYYTSYKILEYRKNQKTNIVKKSVSLLNNKEKVSIFLTKSNKAKGIYYILKESKVPILFTKIYDVKIGPCKEKKHVKNFFYSLPDYLDFGRKIKVDYELVTDYNIDQDPEDFMKYIKNKLYM